MATKTRPAETARLDRAVALRIYRTMLACRLFETRAQELFFEGLVRGTTHLGIGQEAVAAGFAAAMRDDDYTFATYRGHNHALARGAPMGPLLAELFGRASGLMGGKGGSMHISSVAHHMMGSYAIVGAHLPIALGAAWSAQYRKSGQVAVCFFGDGATNIGAFHEALNLAVVWKAPVVFVCENNQYMEYTAIGTVTAAIRAPIRASIGRTTRSRSGSPATRSPDSVRDSPNKMSTRQRSTRSMRRFAPRSPRRRPLPGRRRSPPRPSSRPRSGPMEAPRGDRDVPRGGRPWDRPGDGA